MSNYDWLEFAGRPAVERYPDWVEAAGVWREFIAGSEQALRALLDALVHTRASVPWGVPGTELSGPRVFVSHRRDDDARARQVAALGRSEGFQVWLDVLDPTLQGVVRRSQADQASALEIAVVIEMALLNCTHVIALITPNTRGTMWVPYEYGRVKDSSPQSLRAACWIDGGVTDPPEYLELGVKTTTDVEISMWFQHELAAWHQQYPAPAPVSSLSATIPPSLTAEELEKIADRFRNGVKINLIAPPPAVFKRKPR